MATRKKPKKLTKASVKKMLDAVKPEFRGFVANDPKDKPQAEGANRFVSDERSFEEALSSMARNALRRPAEVFPSWDFSTNDGAFRVRAYPGQKVVRIWRAEFGTNGVTGESVTIRSQEEFDKLAETLNVAYAMTFGGAVDYKEPR